MESFEQFVAVAMESEGLVVSEAIKFPIAKRTKKVAYKETQTHGYEVDLVGARSDRLVLATVKSFFGSRGVAADGVAGRSPRDRENRLFAILNDPIVRKGVVEGAASRFGYGTDQVQLRLYVGRFAAPSRGEEEAAVRKWCGKQNVGAGPIEVFNLQDVVTKVRVVAASKTYRDNPVLVTLKVLREAGLIKPAP